MANTYELISSTTVAGSTAITFSSIPNTYTDLVLRISGRANGYNGTDCYITVNGSSTSYSGKYMWKDGNTTSVTAGSTGTTSVLAGILPGTQAGSTTYGILDAYFINYASGTHKNMRIDTLSERNGNDSWVYCAYGTWENTSAITSITVGATANWLGDTNAYLYGIKNS